MASPDRSKRKILKAKKTMPTSCRKQAEILNKLKTVEVLKTTMENNVLSANQNLSTGVITGECRRPEIVDSSLNSEKNSAFLLKSVGFPQNLMKPIEKVIHSKTKLERIDEQVVCSYKKPRKTIDSPSQFFIQEVKEKWNTSETHFEYKTNITSSFFQHEQNCNLKSSCHSPIILSDVVQNTLEDNKINKMASNLEANSNSESHDERQNDILSSDSCCVPIAKTPNWVNVVSSSNCVANTLKTKESSRTQHSSISDCENTDSKQQGLLNTDGNNSYNQKKMFSENKENVKRMKTSEQINENICVSLERQTAVLEQAKVSRFQKHIKAVLEFQRKCLEANTFSSNKAFKDLDSFDHLPPLPVPLPPPPELVDKIGDTLPPQKPELKVKWVLRPMAIALTWNITKIDPRCAPVESYHLFLCHKNTNDKSIWKKIGEIKALPLPMACTLSEFFASTRYYFTVQSKDIFGRYGPFCDIKSVPGFSDNFI
ncbi:Activating transcription factor 7-interacting protein 2 [Heterocephalus glaber]|uniref:Activating transcription factor 7-interacting protein 2 n=1 Tax=Heterocephalus glaber TaxID=10181 RepID=G5BWF9_HETGA|nr:Activating transcription factor 7-interacting protein 2 [Heterocephalus glaber]